MSDISIALLCSLLGAAISYLSFQKSSRKDAKDESREEAETKAKLDYISRGVDDIKLDNKQRDREMLKMNDRLIIVEQNLKALHRRMDNFEEGKHHYE